MSSELIINVREHETRVALIEDGILAEVFDEKRSDPELVGNIYRGRVSRILPGMQAAFVDIGLERTGFLHVADVHRRVRDLNGETYKENGRAISESHLLRSDHNKLNHKIIDELLHEGQTIMVQIAKEPIGDKGARLTSYFSIPGRYLVLMPGVDHIGVSRVVVDQGEKERLREVIREFRPPDFGFIVRTAGVKATRETLRTEMEFLLKLWKKIQERMENQSTNGLIYKDLNMALRSVRDLFSGEVRRLVVDSYPAYNEIMAFINNYAPELKYSVEYYDGHLPIFDSCGIEKEIARTLDARVPLRSGAYIVIEKTEALTSIDVNTGRYVGTDNLDETILKTNLEAVQEIARQLRLRSIGGIIIIDFISMEKRDNWEIVHHALEKALEKDKAKTNVLPMSELGLIEMTRKRTGPSLSRLLTEPCRYCMGTGRLKSRREICHELMRAIEKESLFSQQQGEIVVSVSETIHDVLGGEELESMIALEKRLNKRITVLKKEKLHPAEYEIFS